jgi:hypothetical protein
LRSRSSWCAMRPWRVDRQPHKPSGKPGLSWRRRVITRRNPSSHSDCLQKWFTWWAAELHLTFRSRLKLGELPFDKPPVGPNDTRLNPTSPRSNALWRHCWRNPGSRLNLDKFDIGHGVFP